ncbi:hypothetical protein HUB98_09685 [Paenibacillus barcinonensis]|uniref:Uncharacterized protein n=1 Tax=Paenibacillus barcinonensis TaxID=198119 RepID=A0ABX6Q4Z6_PAEBA|nr:hypothetical protein [Paenibacillus barcinonensis]QKS56580.1 hypothetical protein HUB98_09685 [Paenibacillus barcinonensis]
MQWAGVESFERWGIYGVGVWNPNAGVGWVNGSDASAGSFTYVQQQV